MYQILQFYVHGGNVVFCYLVQMHKDPLCHVCGMHGLYHNVIVWCRCTEFYCVLSMGLLQHIVQVCVDALFL